MQVLPNEANIEFDTNILEIYPRFTRRASLQLFLIHLHSRSYLPEF
jgi:hypothetical protein